MSILELASSSSLCRFPMSDSSEETFAESESTADFVCSYCACSVSSLALRASLPEASSSLKEVFV